VADRLDLPVAMVNEEVLNAGTEWTDDAHACAVRELGALRSTTPPTQLVVGREPDPQVARPDVPEGPAWRRTDGLSIGR
jgi:hypothetical protein